jgi:dolichol-phosphate mannosyltransferase
MGRASSEHVWVVIPTYNEADNIVDLLDAIREVLPAAHVLVVDDGSPDGTGELVGRIAKEDPRVQLLERSEKSGLGAAYRVGFAEALAEGADVVVEMDADFSHDPKDLPRLIDALGGGAGLAIGSRYVKGGSSPGLPPSRLAISRLGNLYAAVMLGFGVRDATAGFRAYRAAVLELIDLAAVRADGYGFQVEMAYRVCQLGFEIVEVPVEFHSRRAGTSKMSARIVVEAMALCTAWGMARRFPAVSEERMLAGVDRAIAWLEHRSQ